MDVLFQSATEQLRLIRSRQISAEELAALHIAQIERWNPSLNALVDFDPQRIRAQARNAKDGSLHGLPITVKASIATAGHRCEIGSVLYRGQVAEQDAVAVRVLREQGAVVLGTTNCPELLMAYETDNLLYGPTRNPWGLEYSAGGSSGGEAAAIAAGMSAAGIGSDSGGSVREPAHFTGICALKPTAGRISAAGHLPPCLGPFAKLGAIGPMARTMEDVCLLFDVLAQGSARDPMHVPLPLQHPSLADVRSRKIGWLEEDGLLPVTAETREAVRSAAAALAGAGFRVEPFRPSLLEEARKLWTKFFVQCGALFYEPVLAGRHNELSPIFTEFLQLSQQESPLTAQTLLSAWAEWDLLCARFLEEMREYPLLLTPVCAVPAFRHGERVWEIEAQQVRYLDAMRYMQWFNVLGSPAAVVPVGRSRQDLPIGVQIAGRPYEDEFVLACARVLDADFGYRVPPLLGGSTL